MDYKAYSVRNPQELKDVSSQHGGLEVSLQLDAKEVGSSASRWGLRHLIAYRLLTSRDRAFLPTFKSDHDLRCPVCVQNQSNPQKLNTLGMATVLGDNPPNLYSGFEGELMRLPGGFFWVALSRAAHTAPLEEKRAHPERERSTVEREGFVNSDSAIFGSMSPSVPSASEFSGSDHDEVDEDNHDMRRNKPEEVTVHLAICFLQLALHLCLIQASSESASDMEIRPRVERNRTETSIGDKVFITAEDDGGICRMRRRFLHTWEEDNPCLALLEAKRSFKDFQYDERTGGYIPIVSNENLAQYLGEAVITWKGRPRNLNHEYKLPLPNFHLF